jgi:hypothetical protein
MLTIRDNATGQTVTAAPDQLAEAVAAWFEGAPVEVTEAVTELQTAWTPGSSTAHQQDALATYLDVTVTPAA